MKIISAIAAIVLTACGQRIPEIVAPPFPMSSTAMRYHRAAWSQVIGGKFPTVIHHPAVWRVSFDTGIGTFSMSSREAYDRFAEGQPVTVMISAVYRDLDGDGEVLEHEVEEYRLVSVDQGGQ